MSDPDFKHLDQFSNHPYLFPSMHKNVKGLLSELRDIPFSEIIGQRNSQAQFAWVNVGNKIGVKFNADFASKKLAEYKKSLAEIEYGLRVGHSYLNDLKTNGHTNSSQYKNAEKNIAILLTRQKEYIKLIDVLSTKGFYEIATIPEDVYKEKIESGDTRIAITVSIGDENGENKLSDQVVNSLKKKLSYHFPLQIIFVKETKELKPAWRLYHADLPASSDGQTVTTDVQFGSTTNILLKKNLSFGRSLDTVFHEMMHALGYAVHPWLDSYKTLTKNPVRQDITDILHLSFNLGFPDYMNGAYNSFARIVENKSLRSISRALLEQRYGVSASHNKDVVFRFNPEKNKKDFQLRTYNEKDYLVEEFSGNISGLTVHNNSTASVFDFRAIPKFDVALRHINSFFNAVYAEGVTTVLLDSGKSVLFKATFETFQPVYKQYEVYKDQNVDTSLSTKYVKEIFYSPHSDYGYFKSDREITIHPGKGNDVFTFESGKKFKIITKSEENIDTFVFSEGTGGEISLGYSHNDLIYGYAGNDLVFFNEKKMSQGVERHGVIIQNYQNLKNKISLKVTDSLGNVLIK